MPLDVVSPYGHQGAPLGHGGALGTAAVGLGGGLTVGLRGLFGFGEVSEAPGERELRLNVFAGGRLDFTLASRHRRHFDRAGFQRSSAEKAA